MGAAPVPAKAGLITFSIPGISLDTSNVLSANIPTGTKDLAIELPVADAAAFVAWNSRIMSGQLDSYSGSLVFAATDEFDFTKLFLTRFVLIDPVHGIPTIADADMSFADVTETTINPNPTGVPEPGSLSLLGAALLALALFHRRRKGA